MHIRNFSIKETCVACIIFAAMFLYMFNILPVIGPEKIGTREYLAIPASIFVLFLINKMPKIYWGIILANWTQVFFSIATVILNRTNDFWYVQFSIRNILYINGAILIAYLMPRKWKFDTLILFFIAAVFINDIISFIGFLSPKVASFLLSIQRFGDIEKVERTYRFGARVVGIGRNLYFNGGVNNGMAIILTFYLISKKYLNQLVGILLIFIMSIVGLFIARTVIIGLLLGAAYYVISMRIGIKLLISILSFAFILTIIIYFDVFEGLNTTHAFEIFYNYDDLGNVESLHGLSSQYNKTTMNFSTFLMGDGLSMQNGKYYMHTDIGYLRNIFYFGILGTLFGYFYYEYYIFNELYRQNRGLKMLIFTLAAYLLALNLKGLPDYNFMVFLMLAYYIRKSASYNNLRRFVYEQRRSSKKQYKGSLA